MPVLSMRTADKFNHTSLKCKTKYIRRFSFVLSDFLRQRPDGFYHIFCAQRQPLSGKTELNPTCLSFCYPPPKQKCSSSHIRQLWIIFLTFSLQKRNSQSRSRPQHFFTIWIWGVCCEKLKKRFPY